MKIVVSICIILTVAFVSHAKDWRGITPLKSTRVDVERLLGQPTGSCKCIYDTEKERVTVWYSGAPCRDNIPYAYNVARDTVWEISVRPKTNLKVIDLQLEMDRFKKVGDSDRRFVVYYLDDRGGVIVEAAACENKVINVIYKPAPDSRVPTCNTGNGIFDPAYPQKLGEFPTISPATEKDHLDELALVLKQDPYFNCYIVSYAALPGSADDGRIGIELAKKYLVDKCGIDAMRIVTIDGGYRDKQVVEVYSWLSVWREFFGKPEKPNCSAEDIRRR